MQSAYGASAEVLWMSDARTIGKHDWRVTVFSDERGVFTGYEWRQAARTYPNAFAADGTPYRSEPGACWRSEDCWPRFDSNHHNHGLPLTIRKLYAEHEDVIRKTLADARAERKEPAAAPVSAPGMEM